MGSKARIFIVLEYVTGGELHDIIVSTTTASLVSCFSVMGV